MKNTFFETVTQHPLFLPLLALTAMLVMALTIAPHAPQALFAVPFAGVLLSETKRNADFIVSEAPGKLSRDNVTVLVPANTTYLAGQVLSALAADGNHVPFDPAGSDGSETTVGILYRHLENATDEDLEMEGVVINLNAEVRRAALVWADGITDEQKEDAEADLRAVGIKVRPL